MYQREKGITRGREMENNNIIYKLRKEKGMSQRELAEKVMVTRQAVSRWETGDTVPSTDTLKLLSKVFNVSINTLLGTPEGLHCQSCGMPLEDEIISKEPSGEKNKDYCKFCYHDGKFTYNSKEELIQFCIEHFASKEQTAEEIRANMEAVLPTLKHWR